MWGFGNFWQLDPVIINPVISDYGKDFPPNISRAKSNINNTEKYPNQNSLNLEDAENLPNENSIDFYNPQKNPNILNLDSNSKNLNIKKNIIIKDTPEKTLRIRTSSLCLGNGITYGVNPQRTKNSNFLYYVLYII